jgi:REP element-mobilizing transposase RayT
MKFDPQKYHRTSTRLKGYDYSLAGAYFITLVTFRREMLFGEVRNGVMRLNRRGEIAREEWFASAEIRSEIRLFVEEFVVMPNHLHGVVWFVDGMDGKNISARENNARATGENIELDGRQVSVGENNAGMTGEDIVRATGKNIVRTTGRSPQLKYAHPRGPMQKSLGSFVAGYKSAVTKRIRDELHDTGIWQRNYYDHIIRNERELDAIRRYIERNPANWEEDEENLANNR